MPKYRKKPVVIAAEQCGELTTTYHLWLTRYELTHGGLGVVRRLLRSGCWLKTLEGWYRVQSFDWIITGIQGELYPCKPDIFEATYEPCDDEGKARRPPSWLGCLFIQ